MNTLEWLQLTNECDDWPKQLVKIFKFCRVELLLILRLFQVTQFLYLQELSFALRYTLTFFCTLFYSNYRTDVKYYSNDEWNFRFLAFLGSVAIDFS